MQLSRGEKKGSLNAITERDVNRFAAVDYGDLESGSRFRKSRHG
jgi:hypothetical protein